MVDVTWAGESLTLLPDRAVWWARRRTLIVADLHLGKPAAFRAAGVPVPEPVTRFDLERLARLIASSGAQRLVVLGDLLHAPTGMSPEVLEQFDGWRRLHGTLRIVLVRGNHDVRAGDPPSSWGIDVVRPPLIEPPFALVHEPAEVDGLHTLAGHVHPCVHLAGGGGSLRARCFWFAGTVGVLPAFGSFTGGALVRPRACDQVFAIGPDRVQEVSTPPRARARPAPIPSPPRN